MKKIDIIRKNEEFSNIINKRIRINNNLFTIFYVKNNFSYNRYGISVPVKVTKAVHRNRIKRQLKSIIDNNKKEVPTSYDYVIIVKKEILESNYHLMENEILKVFKKVKGEE